MSKTLDKNIKVCYNAMLFENQFFSTMMRRRENFRADIRATPRLTQVDAGCPKYRTNNHEPGWFLREIFINNCPIKTDLFLFIIVLKKQTKKIIMKTFLGKISILFVLFVQRSQSDYGFRRNIVFSKMMRKKARITIKIY